VERFILPASPDPQASLQTWEKLKAYTTTIPCHCKQQICSLERQDCFDGSEVSAIIGS